MNRKFKYYALIWAILLAAFNAVVFLVRPVVPDFVIRYDARFWVAWAFILAAFVGNLACANAAFKAEQLKKLFYRVPLITVSYAGLIATLLLGGGLMLIPNCPAWIAAVVCVLVAAVTAVAVVKAGWAGEVVGEIDEKVAQKTQFIKLLTAEAEALISAAKTPDARAAAKKVCEAVRYSDPMSNADLELQIEQKFEAFSSAVNDDTESISVLGDEVVALIAIRNRRCKYLK